MSSQDAPRQQKTPSGADPQEETVNPSVPGGGPSASPARPEDPSREAEEQRLMEQVLLRRSMIRAYKRVKLNGGAPGIDGMTVEDLMPYLQKHCRHQGGSSSGQIPSAAGAARAGRSHMDAGYQWVVDMDLEKLFDRVN